MSDTLGLAGRRVAVTGAAGFIGSAVVRVALELGASVDCIVRGFEPEMSLPGAERHVADWGDELGLAALFGRRRPDVVVHCAGNSGRGGGSAASMYDANVGTVWRLLDAVRAAGIDPGVVVLSSAAVYGPTPTTPTSEDCALAPATHYAASKVLAEEVAARYVSLESLRVCVARPFNVIGPGEPGGSVASRIIEQFANSPAGEPVTVRLREAESVRDFADVEDVARALLVLGSCGDSGLRYNICTGHGVSIAELVRAVADAFCLQYQVVIEEPGSHPTVSVGCPHLLGALGWRPRLGLAESLSRIVAFEGSAGQVARG